MAAKKPKIAGRCELYNIGAPEVTKHTISCKMCHKTAQHDFLKVGSRPTCVCGRIFDCVWYRPVSVAKELQDYLDAARAANVMVAYDFESDGSDAVGNDPFTRNLVGVSFCREDQRGIAIYVPMRHLLGNNLEESVVKEICAPFLRDMPMAVHGASIMEWPWTYVKWGVEPRIELDTAILMFLDDSNRVHRFDARSVRLKGLAKEIWDIDVTEITDLVDMKTSNFSVVPVGQAYMYGCQDSDLTIMLKKHAYQKVMSEQGVVLRLEHALIAGISKMQLRGVMLNPVLLQEGASKLDLEIDELEAKVFTEMGFDIQRNAMGEWLRPFDLGSNKLVAEQLFTKMGLPYDQRSVGKSGYPSTSEDSLQYLKNDYPVVEALLEWRQAVHMRDGFVASMPTYINPATGYIHANFNQTGAPTGRFSCSGPNLQQIPKIRD